MVMKDITLSPGRAVARPKAKNPASEGLALITEVLDADVVRAMVDAERFRVAIQQDTTFLGEGEIRPGLLDRAKPLHAKWLTSIARAVEVSDLLGSIVWSPRFPVTQADASAMLQYLFGAMGKRRNDEAAAKLLACADVFSPASNALGEALGLWKAAPTHPIILAISIKQLMAAKTFEPTESELREALDQVAQRLSVHKWYVNQWLEKLDRADEIVFTLDRPAWDAAYAGVSSSVALHMQSQLDLAGDGPGEDTDENGVPEHPPSPRWLALNELHAAEEAPPQPEPEQPRLAACKIKQPARRSRKPKQPGEPK